MKKAYFISDLHLGAQGRLTSDVREKLVVKWLQEIATDCSHLFLVGDTFDWWYEYSNAIPKGHHRLLGTLALMADSGIAIYIFAGNHDMWMKSYFTKQLGFQIVMDDMVIDLGTKRFYITHGDGRGPGDHTYKAMKRVFRNSLAQYLFGALHPYLGLSIMQRFSKTSRKLKKDPDMVDLTKERLVMYAEEVIRSNNYDYLVFGHRHIPLVYTLSNGSSVFVNLGDWLHHQTYGVFDGYSFDLNAYDD